MKKVMMFLTFLGFIFLAGAVGAYDQDSFTFGQTAVQCLIGCSLMGAGAFGTRVVKMLHRKKRLRRRYERIRTICDYEAQQMRRAA